jgi:hypothetical protein
LLLCFFRGIGFDFVIVFNNNFHVICGHFLILS